jgi:hypothetical protein
LKILESQSAVTETQSSPTTPQTSTQEMEFISVQNGIQMQEYGLPQSILSADAPEITKRQLALLDALKVRIVCVCVVCCVLCVVCCVLFVCVCVCS